MHTLSAEHISLTFPGQPHTVLQNINLNLNEGSLTVILGESGCGKTTLLNILAGFQQPDSGSIKVNGKAAVHPDARRAVVFQDHALMPWLNVAENVGFALKLQGVNEPKAWEAVADILQTVGLDHVAEANIWALSGGMKQRVGIARALISRAPFILLDEPFAALDAFAEARHFRLSREGGQMVFTLTGDKGHPLTENEALALPRERRTEIDAAEQALRTEIARFLDTMRPLERSRDEALVNLRRQTIKPLIEKS